MLPWSQDTRIAVIGDLILDEYLVGEVNRISPEAPVPVHSVRDAFCRPGGAANTALNVQRAGGQAVIFGTIGNDADGDRLLDLLDVEGVETEGVLRQGAAPTTKKVRIIANNQQIVRVDWEERTHLSKEEESKIISILESSELCAVLVSDYAKGLLSVDFLKRIFEVCQSRNIPSIVDPKGHDFQKYCGATVITPNRQEASDAAGMPGQAPEVLAQVLRDKVGVQDVLITLGSEGRYFRPRGLQEGISAASAAREVYDVSGAGDTVAAIVSLAVASRITSHEMLKVASFCAGMVVEKLGTHSVLRAEIEGYYQESDGTGAQEAQKICKRENIGSFCALQKKRGKKIVFTNGCFDVLHVGHVEYLRKAKAMGDFLIVAVNSDASVSALKGRERPINKESERMQMLAALECVDMVTSFTESSPENVIKDVLPHVLVKGADYKVHEILGRDIVERSGGKVRTVPLVEGKSTTQILQQMVE